MIANTSPDEGIQGSLRKAALSSHFHAGTSTVSVSLDDCFAVEKFKPWLLSMLNFRCLFYDARSSKFVLERVQVYTPVFKTPVLHTK